jgi:hypothetical protein
MEDSRELDILHDVLYANIPVVHQAPTMFSSCEPSMPVVVLQPHNYTISALSYHHEEIAYDSDELSSDSLYSDDATES